MLNSPQFCQAQGWPVWGPGVVNFVGSVVKSLGLRACAGLPSYRGSSKRSSFSFRDSMGEREREGEKGFVLLARAHPIKRNMSHWVWP